MQYLKFKKTKKLNKLEFSILIGLIGAIVLCFLNCYKTSENISRNVLRLHILANSNSKQDQALKLKVRDELIRWSAIPFYDEVRECDRQLEKYLIQTMNKTNSKYYARSGFFYELYMKKYQRFFERTNLYKTVYSDNSLLKVIISKQDEIDRVVSEAAGEEKEEVLKTYYEENLAKTPIDLKKRR